MQNLENKLTDIKQTAFYKSVLEARLTEGSDRIELQLSVRLQIAKEIWFSITRRKFQDDRFSKCSRIAEFDLKPEV